MSGVAKQLASKPAKLEDLLAIPEADRRHEIIDGELLEKGVATGEHGGAQADLVTALNHRFGRRPGGRWPGGWWFATEVEISFAPAQVYRPDVVGWRRERAPQRPTGVPITLLPDWICEILSTNRRNDLVKKKRTYHQCQVPRCWIVDPAEETLAVHRWGPDGYIEILAAQRGEIARAEPFDAIALPVDVLFGDDEPEE
ncbi:Uma2 family endonuclease [Sorangium sp. So ce394]|uniref:Uma2 family endonuclease n=1 Tax=Sorangium sp. So ce394 TaxID=3133310 RepID=UPI003F5C953E